MAILVTGGARSGKSSFAEQYAIRSSNHGVYIATCQSYDEEMADRIMKHQKDRKVTGFVWKTCEEPYEAAEMLDKVASETDDKRDEPPALLLDCLTLWLTNWMLRIECERLGEDRLEQEMTKLVAAIERYPHKLIIVTNEVGDGIVPEYSLGRAFRDEAGRLNQRVAAVCDRVFLVTAGIPVELKALAFRWEQL
ncbi:bifunctional adenosylcobinamide kinase/adenosylcobinamide-phosphate guanylyltransferase [Paenibacillus harenae]|uniref:bifunctional adenosylcobinamide kinase/adenosylcobinamide-phosphate guanylyltransferase n=1 Tax=Paenibacillus harenae TaxID=306543 RepID=UPI0027D80E57|nr:bifunctional adenosylcobinamide kinase/adenosylcobinamide-phosphate guanylyltransferase [Paenibacillus harenae]